MCPLRCLGPYYENPTGAPRKADTYVDLPPSRPRGACGTGKQACASRKLLALHWPFCAGWRGAWTWQHTLLAANMLQPALQARRRSSGARAPSTTARRAHEYRRALGEHKGVAGAESAYRGATAADPKCAVAHHNLGPLLQAERGGVAGAESAHRGATAADPSCAEIPAEQHEKM